MPTKETYKKNLSDLRKLFRDALSDPRRSDVSGQFGRVFNPRYSYIQIYNRKNDTVIATIRGIGSSRVITRYRKNSWYSGLIERKKFGMIEDIKIASNSLARHKAFARNNLEPHFNAQEGMNDGARITEQVSYIVEPMMARMQRSVFSEWVGADYITVPFDPPTEIETSDV